MSHNLLSILIPTVFGREESYNNLIGKLREQFNKINPKDFNEYRELYNPLIKVYYIRDNKEMTIGEKREKLYQDSTGKFSWMIDDDDDIAHNAIELILEAIKSNPEIPCITFKEKCMINGEYKSSNHSIRYNKWQDNFDGYDYVRCPFYKDVIRTDLAKQVPFEHIRWNEDERFSYAIKHLLTDEIHIDEELYHYIYNETNPTERYGFDK